MFVGKDIKLFDDPEEIASLEERAEREAENLFEEDLEESTQFQGYITNVFDGLYHLDNMDHVQFIPEIDIDLKQRVLLMRLDKDDEQQDYMVVLPKEEMGVFIYLAQKLAQRKNIPHTPFN